MDIELLSKMVAELITDRDEVGLPGLGSFVAEWVPASFADRGFTIQPPYRRMTFLPGRSEDDSLVRFYADSNSLDIDQAKAMLQHFLEEIKRVLLEKKTVTLPGLGRLRATRENHVFFVCDEDLDIYPGGFGLPPVSLKSHAAPEQLSQTVASLAAIVEGDPEMPGTGWVPSDDIGSRKGRGPVERGGSAEAIPPVPETPAAEEEPAVPEMPAPVAENPETPAVPDTPAAPVRRRGRRWWIVLLVLILLAALALGVFVLLAHIAPDFIDSILYTPEELRILGR